MTGRLLLDILERVFWTFVQGATSTLILSGFLNVDSWKAAVVGGVAAVLALVKGIAASRMGSPVTAATLPASSEALAAVSGKVTDTTGTVVGEVTGAVMGSVEDAMAILDQIEDSTTPKTGRHRAAKRPTGKDGDVS